MCNEDRQKHTEVSQHGVQHKSDRREKKTEAVETKYVIKKRRKYHEDARSPHEHAQFVQDLRPVPSGHVKQRTRETH